MKFLLWISFILLLVNELFGRRSSGHRSRTHMKQNPCDKDSKMDIKLGHKDCKKEHGIFHYYPKDNSSICCIPQKKAEKKDEKAKKKARRMRI